MNHENFFYSCNERKSEKRQWKAIVEKKRSKSELERSPLRKLDFSVAFSNKKTLRYDDVAARRVCNEFLLTGKSSREDRGDKKA